ncbi:MAG TPA: phytoene/squalene synthase family protein [Nitrospiraceae bacterium]|nr:phytoene/squalene synthase family protein [Nitrospiraceae bacterium]
MRNDSPRSTEAARQELLHDLLKQVSRSFYLTLNVLPRDVRDQMGLSYLFARAADTIADSDIIDRDRRARYLNEFRRQFDTDTVDDAVTHALQAALAPIQHDSAERVLLQRLGDCFAVYRGFSEGDRRRIRNLMTILPNGMAMDLAHFAGGSVATLAAFDSMKELDEYIYYVAGCVGEFWTKMVCAHRPAMAGWDVAKMSTVGVGFGKGLQLTNILKDLARDLQRGRCYVPRVLLRDAGLSPEDLLASNNLPRFRPVLLQLVRLAAGYLDQGWTYTMAIPRLEIRQRLACMWPILLAGETLKRVAVSPALLDPSITIKAPRSVVYRVMALTLLTGGCGYAGSAYWGRLRKQIV